MFQFLLSVVMLATTLVMSGPASAFDEEQAIREHERFMVAYFAREWGVQAASDRFRRTAAKVGAVTPMEVWPVDRTRGAWVNGGKSLGRSRWLGVGVDGWPVEAPAEGEAYAAFFSISYHFMYGFNDSIAPLTCVERPGATGAFHGAAACYFAVRAEYHQPGFWVALREIDGRVVIAGIREHKRALEEPEKDKQLAPFLKEIEKRFGPQPEPKPAPSKGKGGR